MVVIEPRINKSQEDIVVDEHINSIKAKRVSPVAGANSDFEMEVGKGQIPGQSAVFISGENETLNGTFQTIWNVGGRYPILTANTTVEIASTNVNDTILGTGARQITVLGLKLEADLTTRTSISEVVDLNGTTQVELSQQFFRINSITTLTAGSTRSAQGQIDIRNKAVTTEILGRINDEENTSRQMFYSAPSNQTYFAATFLFLLGKDDEIDVKSFLYTNDGIPIASSFLFGYQSILNFKNAVKFNIGSGVDFETIARKVGGAGAGRISMFIENPVVDNDSF